MAKRKPKAEQGFLPEMEPPSIKAVDQAAQIYHDAKVERMKLSRDEDEAKDNLIDKMKEHDLQIYETRQGLVVTLTATSNVKTKTKREAEMSENGDGEEGDE